MLTAAAVGCELGLLAFNGPRCTSLRQGQGLGRQDVSVAAGICRVPSQSTSREEMMMVVVVMVMGTFGGGGGGMMAICTPVWFRSRWS